MKTNSLLLLVKNIIEQAKSQIVRNVNLIMVYTHYEIGKLIVHDEQSGKARAEYAKLTLKQLSEALTKEYGKGYSVDNLELFRKFYLRYQNRISESVMRKSKNLPSDNKSESVIRKSKITQLVNGQTLIPQSAIVESQLPFILSWTHYIQLLKIDNESERRFYEIEAAKNNWSVRELNRQFNSSLYERLALSKDKRSVEKLAKKGQIIEKPTDALKSHYVLEFLDLKEDGSYSESDMETAIISKLEHFMLELGKGFLFEARQKRLTFEGDSFYVDLSFYNRLLRCFVLIDLKIGKLSHENIGQMQMYVNYHDRMIKTEDENPTIGIILCKEENKTVVEFTLPEDNKQIFAKQYLSVLPSKNDLKKQLE